MHVQDAVNDYLSWLASTKQPSPHTLRAYRGDLTSWARSVGPKQRVSRLHKDNVVRFVAAQRESGLAESTISRRVAAISGLRHWLVTNRAIARSSWKMTDLRPKRRRSLPRVARSTDVSGLYTHLREAVIVSADIDEDIRKRPHDATSLLAISLMLATGTRIAETCTIRPADVDISSGSIRVMGKGRRLRTVYISNASLTDLLSAYIRLRRQIGVDHDALLFNRRGRPLAPSSVRLRMATLARAANLQDRVTPHMLRHAAATRLLEEGVDTRIVQRLLGHASITTTEIYTHVTDGALRRALARADVLGRVGADDN